MKTIFVNIAWLQYYQGIWEGDLPKQYGSPIDPEDAAAECFNFQPLDVVFRDVGRGMGEYCLGDFSLAGAGKDAEPQTRLERIRGCEREKNAALVDGVLVVWCSHVSRGQAVVVGWYKNATVCRHTQSMQLQDEDDPEPVDIYFHTFARVEDCVLLPVKARSKPTWKVPLLRRDGFGFGSAGLWYPDTKADEYLERLTQAINTYKGPNWTGLDLSELG